MRTSLESYLLFTQTYGLTSVPLKDVGVELFFASLVAGFFVNPKTFYYKQPGQIIKNLIRFFTELEADRKQRLNRVKQFNAQGSTLPTMPASEIE